jgi:hypothetical protein
MPPASYISLNVYRRSHLGSERIRITRAAPLLFGVRRPHWRTRIVNPSMNSREVDWLWPRRNGLVESRSLGTIAGIDKPPLFAWILWSKTLAQGITPEVYIHHHSGFLPPRDFRESNPPALLDI